jgi:hypothetical protein
VRALVFKFSDGTTEGALQFPNLGRYKLRKTQENGRTNPTPGQIVDYFF